MFEKLFDKIFSFVVTSWVSYKLKKYGTLNVQFPTSFGKQIDVFFEKEE